MTVAAYRRRRTSAPGPTRRATPRRCSTSLGHAPRLRRCRTPATARTTLRHRPRRRTATRRPRPHYWDLDGDGYVSDDERDEDADGLTNYDEVTGPMTAGLVEGLLPERGRLPDPVRRHQGLRRRQRRRRHPRRRRRPGLRRRPEHHGAQPQHGRRRAAVQAVLRRRRRTSTRRDPGADLRQPVQPVPAGRQLADLPAPPGDRRGLRAVHRRLRSRSSSTKARQVVARGPACVRALGRSRRSRRRARA